MIGRPRTMVESEGVLIRRWAVDDATALHEMVLASLDHLRPWMAWTASEPVALAERVAKIHEWNGRWDSGEDFPFAIVAGGALAGACGLHRRVGDEGLELGYWVAADRCGDGVATRAASGLVAAAFSIEGVRFVEIHHDIANIPSGRIPAKLGFTRVAETPDEIVAPGEVGVDVTWRLQRRE